MKLDGSCHCGALTVQLDTDKSPAELPVRTCGCSFCMKHRPRITSDPAGHVTITGDASRYQFGLRLGHFLLCKTCGVFVAAFDTGRAVINLEVFDRAAEFTQPSTQLTVYDTEDVATRTARRAKNWTPATVR